MLCLLYIPYLLKNSVHWLFAVLVCPLTISSKISFKRKFSISYGFPATGVYSIKVFHLLLSCNEQRINY
jgi:hypothetical protein